MGNSSSGLQIRLNPSVGNTAGKYLAGSKISGTVYVQTDGNGGGGDAGLELYLTGKEDVMVAYEIQVGNDDERRQEIRHSYSKRDIVRIDIPLVQAGSGSFLEAGQYAYPFDIQLPEHLPSSFHHENGREGYCNLVYKIKAEGHVEGRRRTSKEEVQFEVLAKPPPSAPVPSSIEPVTSSIAYCCCIPQGNVTFAAHVDDTRVGMSETMHVDFGCKNESSAEINKVEAVIKQKISWESDGHHGHSEIALAEKSFTLDAAMMKRSPSEIREIKTTNAMAEGTLSRGMDDSLLREIQRAVRDGTNKVSLTIPFHTIPTYNGMLIQVYHKLKIKVQTPSCSSNPETKVDLQMVTPNSANGGGAVAGDGGEDVDIPIASAPLPDGWDQSVVTTQPVTYNGSNPTFGGGVVSGATEEDIAVDPFNTPADLGGPTIPSAQALVRELPTSISARTTILERIADPKWDGVFKALQPQDLVSIVKAVTMEFDQADVAEIVAKAVEEFTCAYVVALIRSISDWLRIQFVQKLLPLCVDAKSNSSSVLNELTDWERISTEREFENVLNE